MQYMGGKARIAKRLAAVMLDLTDHRGVYIEPFVGGGNVLAQMAPHFRYPYAGDAMEDVALLWQAVQDGWVPPTDLTRDEWYRLKIESPSALRAFAGFGCSFGGRFFEGYASCRRGDDYAGAAARDLKRKRPALARVVIDHLDYRKWSPGPGHVVYCDPPYAGTTAYGGMPTWEPGEFWTTAQMWVDAGAIVFVSEYAAPPGWEPVWSAEVRTSLKSTDNRGTVTEKLFMRKLP